VTQCVQTRASLAIAIVLLASGCASYQVGNRSLYRPDVRTVYVPMFESASLRRNLGERLTEAVVKEIELKTPYKVVHRPDADTVLSARITSDSKRVVATQVAGVPRNIETDMSVQVSWYDRRGEYLIQDARFRLSPLDFSVVQSVDFTPEGGQSVATAQQEAIQRLAVQIVSRMESDW
jgi:Lipopolysaccharide-assembly